MSDDRDYYCSRQFSELTLNLEIKTISACCAAEQKKIDFDDLEQSGLLNLSFIKNDRGSMIDNVRVSGCEQSCWTLEDSNLPSVRLLHQTNNKIYQQTHVDQVQTVNISLGSRCALTCSYCNKTYSRSWTEDIKKHGAYSINGSDDDQKYTLSKKDKLIKIIDQSTLYSSQSFQTLIKHLSDNKSAISTWYIMGGEPFLYEEQLLKLLEIIPQDAEIVILSGLGVPKNKFINLFNILQTRPNFKLGISAENTGQLYEFNRYGNSYQNFLQLLDHVHRSKIRYQFYSTLSNITAFGYVDFVKFVSKYSVIEETLCASPNFLKIQNIDNDSRLDLLELIDKQNNKQLDALAQSLQMNNEVLDIDRLNLSTFLKEFSTRRNLDLSIFPKTFLKWLDIHVVQ